MTAGYDPTTAQPGGPAPEWRPAEEESPQPGEAGPSHGAAPRYGTEPTPRYGAEPAGFEPAGFEAPGFEPSGPMPPRFEPSAQRTWSGGPSGPGATAAYPPVPAASWTAAPGYPTQPGGAGLGYPAQPGGAAPGYPTQLGGAAPGYPTQPGYPASGGQPGATSPISAPPPLGGPYPVGGSGLPAFGQPVGPGPVPAAGPRIGPGWPRVVAVLMGALILLAAVQAYQINRLSDRLGRTDRQLADGQRTDAGRLDGLAGRTDALEKQVGGVFNPEAVASQVLPSVFRVRAGQFTGTAFAIGKPAPGGGTNLFTNFHVVESVWKSGGRKVDLEHTDQRFPATIVKVDETNDVAQLRTDGSFTGLTPAPEAVKSGQQIVVVGAPLGLEDTVTTGVVSAFRKAEDKSGPMVQFDAPINPGNSGGPVINGAKQVVGIATAKARNAEGIGLAIPIKTACDSIPIC